MENISAFKDAIKESESLLKGGLRKEAFNTMKEYMKSDPEIKMTKEWVDMAVSPLGYFILNVKEEELK